MKKILLPAILSLSVSQLSCVSGEEPAFGDGSTSDVSESGIPAVENFRVDIEGGFQIEVFDPDFGTYDSSVTSGLIGFAYDRNGAPVDGLTINFDVEWGVFPSGRTCTTDTTGSCSVEWAIGDTSTVPNDYCTRVVAYTTGEESFFDSDGDNVFDDDDVASTLPPFGFNASSFIDVSDPFFDTDWDGAYTLNIDIPVPGFGTHTPADGQYNGSASCTATGLCSTTQTITIWDRNYIDLKDETKGSGTVVAAPTSNTCTATLYP